MTNKEEMKRWNVVTCNYPLDLSKTGNFITYESHKKALTKEREKMKLLESTIQQRNKIISYWKKRVQKLKEGK